jgi:hypothetical protein
MGRKKKATSNTEEKPSVHKDLDGMNITINSFGELSSTVSIDRINDFLNKNVEDKKLPPNDSKEQ